MKKQSKKEYNRIDIEVNKSKSKSKQLVIFSICSFLITGIVFMIKSSNNSQVNLAESGIQEQNICKLTGSFEKLNRIYRDNVNNAQYTQGLLCINKTTLLESSGQYGKSSIHFINLDDINTLQHNNQLPYNEFGEGCDIINNKVYQLTWQDRKMYFYEYFSYVYDVENLTLIEELKLDSKVKEGWGLTHRIVNGSIEVLITDGSNKVHIADENFKVLKSIPIIDSTGKPQRYLNELEYVNGILYANIYLTSNIVAIDLDNQTVIATYNFSELVKEANTKYDECLNGIAYNQDTQTFWITGKNWGFIQEVKLF